MKKFSSVLLLTMLLVTLTRPISAHAASSILYVKETASGSANCSSWANACTLQTALAQAEATDEIWVQAGVYKPGSARTDNFTLESGVALYGGFAGTESSRGARDWVANKTILSGDIDNNDITSNGIVINTANIVGENSYHVVIGSGVDSTAILDGFTVTAGQADDSASGNQDGGGIYNNSGSPTIRNVIFQANYARADGGGMYNNAGSPNITSVFFIKNSAVWGAGLNNNNGSSPNITNVVFFENSALSGGGGMFNRANSSANIVNATFYGNQVTRNDGLDGGGILLENSAVIAINTILWGNIIDPEADPSRAQIAYMETSSSDVAYSIVQGGWPGNEYDNLNVDPRFVDAENGNLKLQGYSPAIDAGTDTGCPIDDIDGVGRPQQGTSGNTLCDIGAYEFVIPDSSTKTFPANSTTNQSVSPTLSWNASENTSYYEYCYSSVPGPCTKWNSVGANTSVTLNGLAPNYTYYWQVRANGITEADDGTWWSFTTTATPACSFTPHTIPTTASFVDVPMNHWAWNWIERYKSAGLTTGCSWVPGGYCPGDLVTREQMAVFIMRAKNCGNYTPATVTSAVFSDVPANHWAAGFIRDFRDAKITSGCSWVPGGYCPGDLVTREQMAVFIIRAIHGGAYSPPAVTAPVFSDVPANHWAATYIKQFYNEGITTGCSWVSGGYCPGDLVTREQMAVFIGRAFKLLP